MKKNKITIGIQKKSSSDEDRADVLFQEALDECLVIRKQRKEIYGNCWFQTDGVEASFWGGIINKVNRIKILHKNRHEKNGYENYADCLRDLVILTLFTLSCLKEEQK